MLCDELKVYVPQDGPWGLEPEEGGKLVEEETCYLKSDVDAAIAELKKKLEDVQASMYCDVVDANMENRRLKEERRWRKFSEELPSHDTWCIVYHEGEIDVDHYTDDCNSHDRFVMYGDYVTHWMPLPKAPKDAK